jgi:hypothetical protein
VFDGPQNLLDGFNLDDFRDSFFEMGLNALLKRQSRHGAAYAMALKPDFNYASFNGNQFYVSTVCLNVWSNFVKSFLHSFFESFTHSISPCLTGKYPFLRVRSLKSIPLSYETKAQASEQNFYGNMKRDFSAALSSLNIAITEARKFSLAQSHRLKLLRRETMVSLKTK